MDPYGPEADPPLGAVRERRAATRADAVICCGLDTARRAGQFQVLLDEPGDRSGAHRASNDPEPGRDGGVQEWVRTHHLRPGAPLKWGEVCIARLHFD